MDIAGRIEDFPIVDVLQYIHGAQQNGVLSCQRAELQARIHFRDGQIVRASLPQVTNIGDLLLEEGSIGREDLKAAVAVQKSIDGTQPLGRILIDMGVINKAALGRAVQRQVEHVVYSLTDWRDGEFRFVPGEGGDDSEVAIVPEDLISPEEADTQALLRDAVEHLRNSDVSPPQEDGDSGVWFMPPGQERRKEPAAKPAVNMPIAVVGGSDSEPLPFLRTLLGESRELVVLDHPERLADWIATQTMKDALPLAILTESSSYSFDTIRRWCDWAANRTPPLETWMLGAKLSDPQIIRLYASGVRVCLPWVAAQAGSSVSEAALRETILHRLSDRGTDRSALPAAAPAQPLEKDVQLLKWILGAGRRGNEQSSEITTSFLRLLRDHVERAILFLVRPQELIGLVAIGPEDWMRESAGRVPRFKLPLKPDGAIRRCLEERSLWVGRPQPGEFDALYETIGAPHDPAIMMVPVAGLEQVAALAYGDSGTSERPVDGEELLELAAGQVGLIFENIHLRKRVKRESNGQWKERPSC